MPIFSPTPSSTSWVHHYSSLKHQCIWPGCTAGPLRCTYCHNSFKASPPLHLVGCFCFLDPKLFHVPSLLEHFLSFSASSMSPAFRYFLSSLSQKSFLLPSGSKSLSHIFCNIFSYLKCKHAHCRIFGAGKDTKREIRIMGHLPTSSVSVWYVSSQCPFYVSTKCIFFLNCHSPL